MNELHVCLQACSSQLQILKKFLSLLVLISSKLLADAPAVNQASTSSTSKRVPTCIANMLQELEDDVAETVDHSSATDKEIDLYKSLPRVPDCDPLEWWRCHQSTFPYLSMLARKYLAIQATSVSSERVFSSAGNIVSCKRSSLKPAKINKLCFLAANLKM